MRLLAYQPGASENGDLCGWITEPVGMSDSDRHARESRRLPGIVKDASLSRYRDCVGLRVHVRVPVGKQLSEQRTMERC